MPSRADRRAVGERVARAAALVLVLVAIWRLATTSDSPAPVHAHFDGGVDAQTRDSLAALAGAGQPVSWSGRIESVAAMAEPTREPAAGTRVTAVSTGAAGLRDHFGPLDSVGAGGGTLTAHGVQGAISVREGGTEARAGTDGHADDGAGDRTSIGRVLVLGRANWESKFVVAALEEDGWAVDARLRLADTMRVTQGTSTDPSRVVHAAIVVLDTALGASAGAVARFVRAGGGLVLAGDGAGAPSLAALAPARVIGTVAPESRSFEQAEPLRALPRVAFGAMRSDVVTLDERDGGAAIAARRVGAGRVVQSGYLETWRWRMQGERGSVEAHRAFWTRLVAAAAAAPPRPRPTAAEARAVPGDDGAPLAAVVQALGPRREEQPGSPSQPRPLPAWAGIAILALLLGEWASRRTRGVA